MAIMVSGAEACAEAIRKLQVQFERFGEAVKDAFVPMRQFVSMSLGELYDGLTVTEPQQSPDRADAMLYALEGIHTPEAARREAARLLNGGPSTWPRKP